MKKHTWILTLTTLFLAATLIWADGSFAQQGQGGPRRGAAAQGAGPGKGPGNVNCPYYPRHQNCPQGGAGKNQTWTCPRVSAPQTPATPQGQTPAPQSGK